jgi:hypothetical protein
VVSSGSADSATADSSATTEAPTAATTVVSRTILEDFPNCGEKGTSTRVVGGTEIVQNEYPWLCSLKYKVVKVKLFKHVVGHTENYLKQMQHTGVRMKHTSTGPTS